MIDQHGADAVRMGMLLCSPAGNDLLYDEGLIEQGRNFCNKMWNAFRLVKNWQVDELLEQPASNQVSVTWFESQFAQTQNEIKELLASYKLSEGLMAIYKLFWDDFCSWYLEMVKPAYQQPIDRQTLASTVNFFEELVQIIHPFLPFITEEIWQMLKERSAGDSIMISRMPGSTPKFPGTPKSPKGDLLPSPSEEGLGEGLPDAELLKAFGFAREVIMAIRNVRKEKNIPHKERISLMIRKNNDEPVDPIFDDLVAKLCGIGELSYVGEKQSGTISFIIRTTEFYIPLSSQVNVEEELQKLNDELEYTRSFLASVEKKLNNERFVNNAPQQVVELEQKKKADAEARIRVLEEKRRELT